MKNKLYKTLLIFICVITGYNPVTAQTLPETDGKVIYENLRLEKRQLPASNL